MRFRSSPSALIERDLDLIAPMAVSRLAAVYVSITTLDPDLARILEPRARRAPAAADHRGLARAVCRWASASPVIPSSTNPNSSRCSKPRSRGASRAFSIVLRLPWEVNRCSSSGWNNISPSVPSA